MAHVLIFGIGPIPIEKTSLFHAGGNRAWHLAEALRNVGHRVTLLCMRVTARGAAKTPIERIEQETLTYVSVDEVTHFSDDSFLRRFIEETRPDLLVGACAYPAARAAVVAGDLPLWVDLHGYQMGEAQVKAFRDREDGFRFHFWNRYRPALERGDRFSTTSNPHRYAVIGELGAIGRLNRHTFGQKLVHTIPIGWATPPMRTKPPRHPDHPFIVFHSGGFNTWCDVATLFHAVESAMQKNPRIRFLSTGGAIDGHDEATYPEFQRMIAASSFRDRFDLRGWVPNEDLPAIRQQADLFINVDRFCYETLIGARNRITEMMAHGIPILSTLGTEISRTVQENTCGLGAPIGDIEALCEQILWAADHPELLAEMARNAREIFQERFTYHATAIPLLEWVETPVRAGDAGKEVALLTAPHPADPIRGFRAGWRLIRDELTRRLRGNQ